MFHLLIAHVPKHSLLLARTCIPGVRSVGTIRGNLFLVRMRGLPSTIDDWRRIVRLQSGLFH